MLKEIQLRKKIFHLDPKSSPAWIVILGFISAISLAVVIGSGTIGSLIFVFGSFGVGLFLYIKYPHLYVSFTWFLWLFSALIFRLIEYRGGIGSVMGDRLVAPRLVTALSFITLVKYLPKLVKLGGLPFLLCIGSTFYAFLLSFVQQSVSVSQSYLLLSMFNFLGWCAPIVFAFHLFLNWREYPLYRNAILHTFLWSTLVMGGYAIFQYYASPEWDLLGIEEIGSEWMGIGDIDGWRVWSTMGHSYAFAFNIFPGLILLQAARGGILNSASTIVGYASFLICRIRTGWIAFIIAFLSYFFSVKFHKKGKIFVFMIISFLIIVPILFQNETLQKIITTRLSSFSGLNTDYSLADRTGQFQRYSLTFADIIGRGIFLNHAFGFGMGDMGFMTLFISLGLPGTIFFCGGMLKIFATLFQSSAGISDDFFIAARAIAFASVARIPTSAISFDENAMPVWGFIGIACAAHKYFYQSYGSQLNRTTR